MRFACLCNRLTSKLSNRAEISFQVVSKLRSSAYHANSMKPHSWMSPSVVKLSLLHSIIKTLEQAGKLGKDIGEQEEDCQNFIIIKVEFVSHITVFLSLIVSFQIFHTKARKKRNPCRVCRDEFPVQDSRFGARKVYNVTSDIRAPTV